MKRILFALGTALVGFALLAPAQQGRGGTPRAYGDSNKDGRCDITGQAVGQGRGRAMSGRGQKRGCGGANCPRNGQTMGRGRNAWR